MPTIQKPYCVAMIVCEAAHRCPSTGKFTMLGTFSRIMSEQTPIAKECCVYFVVTDGAGNCDVGLRIVDASSLLDDDGSKPLFEMTLPINFSDPLEAVEGAIGLNVVFPDFGVYHCELFVGDDMLMSRRLVVSKAA